MARDNAELVRRAMEAFQESQQLLTEAYAPDWVWCMGTFEGWLGRPEFIGADEFYEFMADWLGPYDEWTAGFDSIEGAAENRVVGVLSQQGRLRDSDARVDMHYGLVWTLKDGLIERVDVYGTPEEAIEAAGRPRA